MPNIKIPYSRQLIEQDDIDAVTAALKSDFLTQGPHIKSFEEAVAQYCGARFAVAFCNGTAALHAACMAADLGPGDEGIVPPISFVATANCLAYVGATPRFSDVQLGIPVLDPHSVAQTITSRTRVIIPVHFAGSAAPMAAISELAGQHRLLVIEDACHALGGAYQSPDGQWIKIGSCRHSDMTVFSFHPVKNITTGEGGMITTNDPQLYQRLRSIRHHGIVVPENENNPAWYYEMRSLGYNFRMTDIQAALGNSQLSKIDRMIAARRHLFERYRQELTSIPGVKLLEPPTTTRSALHLCLVQLQPDLRRDEVFGSLRAQGIGVQLHYMPIYRHPYYRNWLHLSAANFPHAEHYFAHAMSIPLYPSLTTTEQDFVIRSLRAAVSQARRPYEDSHHHSSAYDLDAPAR